MKKVFYAAVVACCFFAQTACLLRACTAAGLQLRPALCRASGTSLPDTNSVLCLSRKRRKEHERNRAVIADLLRAAACYVERVKHTHEQYEADLRAANRFVVDEARVNKAYEWFGEALKPVDLMIALTYLAAETGHPEARKLLAEFNEITKEQGVAYPRVPKD